MTDPFSGNIPQKISTIELFQAIRVAIASECDATNVYVAIAEATDDPVAKKVLFDIAKEEQIHIGELTSLLTYLDPSFSTDLEEGKKEVEDMIEELKG